MVRRTVEAVRRSPGRAFVYAYWSELDHLAHRHGVGSDRVAAHLAELDLAVEALRQALEGSGTLLVVTADHGFVDVPPERQLRLEDYPELASALALPLCGEPRTAYCYVRPHQARRFPERVAALLGDGVAVRESASLITDGWLGPGPTHPRLADRVGDWTLLMADGYALTDRLQGEKRHPMVGFHGGASDVERRVPLVAWEL
jgi:arylsulfatase A-like enzyme